MTQSPNQPTWPAPPADRPPPPIDPRLRPVWQPGPRPSWLVPIAAGALTTAAMHGLAVWDNILWMPVCFTCGCTGVPFGLLPALLAVRRDPLMGAGSGFALSFIATGLGAIAPAALTIWRGFHLTDDQLEAMRQGWAELKMPAADIQKNLDLLQEYGGTIAVLAAALVALSGGITGAIVAALGGRRHRRAQLEQYRASPPAPPGSPS